MNTRINVLIVDDHTIIRDALKGYFADDRDVEIIGEAKNGKDAIAKIEELSPDLVLTDISMPVMDGHELVKSIKANFPGIRVITLTMINETQEIKKMLSIGVDGYVLKNCDKSELKSGIEVVMEGQSYYSANVMHRIMQGLSGKNVRRNTAIEMPLSSREKEVLELVLKERTNSEIANELFISVRTVDTHKRNLLEKTGSKNLVGLVIYAVERGLL